MKYKYTENEEWSIADPITVQQAMAISGLSDLAIYYQIAKKKIAFQRLGKIYLISEASFVKHNLKHIKKVLSKLRSQTKTAY
jgi:hypothetical protein